MKYRTDLILGEAFCIFIFFYFLYSGLSVFNGLQFYFWLRDSENRDSQRFLFRHGALRDETKAAARELETTPF